MKPHTSLPRWLRHGCVAAILCATAATQASAQEVQVLTLDDAVNYALQNSPDFIKAERNLESTRLRMRIRDAQFKPNLRFGINPFDYDRSTRYDSRFADWYTSEGINSSANLTISQPIAFTDGDLTLTNRLSYRNDKSDAGGKDTSTTSYTSGITLSYSQPIFTFNQTKMDLRDLEIEVIESEYNYVQSRLSLESRITQQFYQLFRSKANLQIQDDRLKSSRTDYEITVNQVKAGIIAESQLFQAETTMLQDEMNYQDQVQSYETAKDNFKLLIGLPIDEDFDIEYEVVHTPVEIDPDFAVEIALKNSLEIITMGFDLEQAENALIRAAEENDFSGTLEFSYGMNTTEEDFGDLYSDPTRNQGFGLQLTVPFWDWGVSKMNYQRQQISYQNTLLDQEEQRKQIVLDMHQSVRDLDNQLFQIDMAQRSEESSRRSYEISRAEYQNGDLSNLQLSQVAQQYAEARQSTIQALLDYKLSLLQLKIDTFYDFENNVSILPEITIGEVD